MNLFNLRVNGVAQAFCLDEGVSFPGNFPAGRGFTKPSNVCG